MFWKIKLLITFKMDPIYLSLVIIGYTIFSYTSSDKTGGEDQFVNNLFDCEITTSLRFDFGTIIIHFHHWLICLIGYWIFHYLELNYLKYVMLGGIIQGIVNYHDWKNILIFNHN